MTRSVIESPTTSALRLPTETTRKSPAGAQVIRVVTTFEEFLELEQTWNRVLAQADISHPFLEHSWVRTWLECFGQNSLLRIVVVNSGSETVAIAPLILTHIRMWGIPARQLGLPYNDHVPRADFIVARGYEDAYEAILNYLRRSREWDVIQLCQLPADSETLAQLLARAPEQNCRTGLWVSGASPCVALESQWMEYYEGLPAKHKSNLRNRFKRLGQLGPVEMETVTQEGQVPDALAQGLELEAAAWKRGEGTAITCDRDITRFYATFAQRAANLGWLRLNFLRAGSDRIAFDYSLSYRNQIFLLKLGYNPEFSAYSPSNLLLSLALQDAFGRGYSRYDFLGDQADWKKCWTKASAAQVWLFLFPNTFKGRLLHLVKFQLIPMLRRHSPGSLRALVVRAKARLSERSR